MRAVALRPERAVVRGERTDALRVMFVADRGDVDPDVTLRVETPRFVLAVRVVSVAAGADFVRLRVGVCFVVVRADTVFVDCAPDSTRDVVVVFEMSRRVALPRATASIAPALTL